MKTKKHRAKLVILSVILLFFIICFISLFFTACFNTDQGREVHCLDHEVRKAETRVIKDRPAQIMPLYLQKDPAWSDIPYGSGTIGDTGCGLTCAAMIATYVASDNITPPVLAAQSDGAFLTDGINDPDKISQWMVSHYNMLWSGEQWTLDEGLSLVEEGYTVIASVHGKLGNRTYNSHNILIYGKLGSYYLIRDPDDGANSTHLFTYQELQEASWGAFNGLM